MTRTKESSFALQVFEPEPDLIYSIDAASRITNIPRHTIAVYCRYQLVSPVVDPEGGWYFDDQAIRALRRVEELRTVHGANLTAIRMIFDLMRQIESLQGQLRFLRT